MKPAVTDNLRLAVETLGTIGDWTTGEIERGLRDLLEREQLSAGKVLQPIRVAISGGSVSPGIFESLAVLGRERSLSRIEAAIGRLDAAASTPD